MANDYLVWVDCEMTGLDLERDVLIEIAVLVTTAELEVLGDGVQVVIAPPAEALAQMNGFVRNMHTVSGLLEELPSGVSVAEAEARVMEYIRAWVPGPRQAPLAGNTVHTDRAFIARQMPALDAHLHYRHVDVSSIKELARRWHPAVYAGSPPKTGNHRALGDIRDSVDELRYYRAQFFQAPQA